MRGLLLLGIAALAASGLPLDLSDEGAEPEDQLKAATVLAILQNSTWAKQEGDARLTVGVLGREAIAEALRHTLDGKTINGRTVRVMAVTGSTDPRCCRVYYIANNRRTEWQTLLPAAGKALTIGEDDRFLENGGALYLYLTNGHMAFEASLAALQQCGVTISSRLLRFGRVWDKRRAP